jgi:hypothetical protein
MHYYDHYHDPSAHLQLTRQLEDELLRAGERRELWPALLARLRALLRSGRSRRDAALGVEVTGDVIRELRAVRRRLDALERSVERLQ